MLPLPSDEQAPGRADGLARRKLRGVVGFVIGIALFAAAVWAILSSDGDFEVSLEAARHAPWWIVAAVVVLPILNWLLISTSFMVLQSRYAPVGWGEMTAIIGSAWLLNYLPFKPGMFGRLAYHKHVNGIRYADSARVLVASVSLSGLSIGLLLVIALLVRFSGPAWGWLWCVPPPVALGVAAVVLAPHTRWKWRLATAGLLRYLDTMVWIGRYAAAFALIGSPLDFQTALFVAAVSQVALLIPIAGNGLGIREWGVRAASAMQVGLLADVVNRAAEVAVALPIGVVGSIWAARRLARMKAVTRDQARATPEQAGSDGHDGESGR